MLDYSSVKIFSLFYVIFIHYYFFGVRFQIQCFACAHNPSSVWCFSGPCSFKIGSSNEVLAALELAIQLRLSLNSKIHLPLPPQDWNERRMSAHLDLALLLFLQYLTFSDSNKAYWLNKITFPPEKTYKKEKLIFV